MSMTITIDITSRRAALEPQRHRPDDPVGRPAVGAAVGALVAALASVPSAYTMSALVMTAAAVIARVLLRAAPVRSVASGR
jgi:hypothetical protein